MGFCFWDARSVSLRAWLAFILRLHKREKSAEWHAPGNLLASEGKQGNFSFLGLLLSPNKQHETYNIFRPLMR